MLISCTAFCLPQEVQLLKEAVPVRPRENCFTKSDRALKSAGMDPDRHVFLRWAYAQRCQKETVLRPRLSEEELDETKSPGPNHCGTAAPLAQRLSPLKPSLPAVVPLARP